MNGHPNQSAPDTSARGALAEVWNAIQSSWRQPGRLSGLLITLAPSTAFIVFAALFSLTPALVAVGVAALLGFAYRLLRREPLRQALIGLVLVAVCAAVAVWTGQARGFFLLPALIPFAVIVVCVWSLLVRRPLTGLILGRVVGGPAHWYAHPALQRIYTISTLVCFAVNVVNATLQAVFYLASDTWVLAAAHIATGPIFAAIVAVTVVYARKAGIQSREAATS